MATQTSKTDMLDRAGHLEAEAALHELLHLLKACGVAVGDTFSGWSIDDDSFEVRLEISMVPGVARDLSKIIRGLK